MDHLYGVDEETLKLMIQLQLEDFEEAARTTKPKGKGRANEQDVRADFLTAIEAYRNDLQTTAQIMADEAMCRSIAVAVETDADMVGAAIAEEQQTAQDRELAFRLSGRRRPAADRGTGAPQEAAVPSTIDDDLIDKLRTLNLSISALPCPPSPPQAESSSWAQSRRPPNDTIVKSNKPSASKSHPKPEKRRPCIACTESHRLSNLTTGLACGHEYCRDCLRSLFSASLTDETLFPPRCCKQPIPLDRCAPSVLNADMLAQYRAKKVEFDTPASKRTYCHRGSCSTFVPLERVVGDVAYCKQAGCGAWTCVVCKGAAHEGADCPADPATQDMLGLAAAEGWQRCLECKRFVELDTGCFHITCRCGAQFCYLCGVIWKRCACPQWDEGRLLRRAEANVDRDAGAARMDHRQRAHMVEQEREHLRENHECGHDSWGYRSGRHRCEECHDTLPRYIFECRQCHLMVCNRCRLNRL